MGLPLSFTGKAFNKFENDIGSDNVSSYDKTCMSSCSSFNGLDGQCQPVHLSIVSNWSFKEDVLLWKPLGLEGNRACTISYQSPNHLDGSKNVPNGHLALILEFVKLLNSLVVDSMKSKFLFSCCNQFWSFRISSLLFSEFQSQGHSILTSGLACEYWIPYKCAL